MIDREARNKAAETIRHYVCGVITNREFEKRYPNSKSDPIIRALDDSLWPTYDDIVTHTLAGKNAVTKDLKERAARRLLFLYSNTEYQWLRIGDAAFRDLPADSWFGNVARWVFRYDERSAAFMNYGDYNVWPFLRRDEFITATSNKRLHRTRLSAAVIKR